MVLLEGTLLSEAKELQEDMSATRRYLHQHPELGMDLAQTRDFVEQKLQEMGYIVTRVGKAGLTTTVGNSTGKVILLRADMDALPIQEVNDLPYRSEVPGRMHACGHDMHTTMLLAAAKLLKQHESEIPGTVKFMFQPGEEIMEGSKDMIDNGILENPRPDVAVMLHVLPGMPLEVGSVMTLPGGPQMASVDWFDITITGKGGHGSMPYLAHDPLVPMAAIQQALHTIQSRDLPPNAIVAMTIGDIKGCETSNVIPETLKMGGTIRTYDEEHRALVKERMVEISENIAKAFNCTATVSFPVGAPFFQVDAQLSEHIQQILPLYLGADKFIPPFPAKIPGMGSEDFAYISHELPTSSLILVSSDAREGGIYNVHHPKLVLDERALPYGAAAYAGVALSWLEANQAK